MAGVIRSDDWGILPAGVDDPPMDSRTQPWGNVRAQSCACDIGGQPLREVLAFARDLVALANEVLAADPQAGEHARGMAMHMAEQLAAVERMLGPMERT